MHSRLPQIHRLRDVSANEGPLHGRLGVDQRMHAGAKCSEIEQETILVIYGTQVSVAIKEGNGAQVARAVGEVK
jgi:hypothetical protein